MEKIETSLENLISGISENNFIKTNEWSLRDINNVETSDRKLIINKNLSFWVHDEALKGSSYFFAELFNNKCEDLNLNNKNIAKLDSVKNKITDKKNAHDKLGT